ncbi:hypothetical protein KCU78_g2579, partial [Aureobasidium melanogenum]
MGFLDWIGLNEAAKSVNTTLDESKNVMTKLQFAVDNFSQNGAVRASSGYSSGQPTVPRDVFVKAILEHYNSVFNRAPGDDCWHVLVLYDQLNVLGSFYGVVGPGGRVSDGPLGPDNPTAHLYVSKGRGLIGKWGFKVYVFKEGQIHNLGDGG